jgi:hypothetical protein
MNPWIYKGKPILEVPTGMVGFVYCITCNITRRKYIGKKFCFSRRRKKVAGRKNRKVIIKESEWQTYWSSSAELKADVAKLGKESFTREILEFYKMKKQISYAEIEQQIKNDVLTAQFPDGTFIYYNSNILGRYFR